MIGSYESYHIGSCSTCSTGCLMATKLGMPLRSKPAVSNALSPQWVQYLALKVPQRHWAQGTRQGLCQASIFGRLQQDIPSLSVSRLLKRHSLMAKYVEKIEKCMTIIYYILLRIPNPNCCQNLPKCFKHIMTQISERLDAQVAQLLAASVVEMALHHCIGQLRST